MKHLWLLFFVIALPLAAQDLLIQPACSFPGQQVFSFSPDRMLVEYLDAGNQNQVSTPFFLMEMSTEHRLNPEETWRGRQMFYLHQDDAHREVAYHSDAVFSDGLIYALGTQVRLFEAEPFVYAKTVSISDPTGEFEGSELVFRAEYEEVPIAIEDRYTRQIAKVGDFLYVSLGNLGLRIINVSDPANMTVIDSVGFPVVGLAAEGNRLAYIYEDYIEDQPFHFLTVLNVTDPGAPQYVEVIRFDQPFDWLTIYDQYLWLHTFLLGGNECFVILNLRNENLLDEYGEFWSGYSFAGLNVAFANGKMFGSGYSIADSSARIGVWNLDDPFHPQLESSFLDRDLARASYEIAADADELGEWIYLFGNNGDTEAGTIYTYYYGPQAVPSKTAPAAPSEFRLASVYPNPFNSTLTAQVSLPATSVVRMDLIDAAGRIAGTIFEGKMDPGLQMVSFEAYELPAGVYFVKAQAGAEVRIAKVALVR